MSAMTLTNWNGEQVEVTRGDACQCRLDGCRVRFVRWVDSTSVEVMSDADGRVLPDYRHPTQLVAWK